MEHNRTYPPKHYQESNKNKLIKVIEAYPLATVISVHNNKPIVSHLPLFYKDSRLVGHIDKSNPQANLLSNNLPISIIFSGPDSYISPHVYQTKNQLPTYNYIKVHVTGNVVEIADNQKLKQSLIELTHFLKTPQHNYPLKPDNPKMDAYLKYIKGFEVEIESWEGKFKLSQDKSKTEQSTVKTAMLKQVGDRDSKFLNTIL